MSNGVLKVSNLTRRYGDRAALEDVSFAVQPGVCVILGPNGAGKSTLLRILATADRPSTGSYEIAGRSALSRSGQNEARRQIGWLPQVFGYEPRSTVDEFLTYFAWLRGVPKGRRRDAVAQALLTVGLSDRAKDRLKTLSGGMIRRVGIAQAIVAEAPFLLLDEPTAGLDPVQRQEFYGLLRNLRDGRTIVLATHLTEDVEEIADSVIVLGQGHVIWHGPVAELRRLAGDQPMTRVIATLMTGRSTNLSAKDTA